MRLAGASGSGNSADGRVGSQYLFRDTDGNVGALSECCPHRGASLYFGRNEECRLRCAYHGWKFDVHGNCVDLPTRVRSATLRLPVDADWRRISERARNADSGAPPAAELPLIS